MLTISLFFSFQALSQNSIFITDRDLKPTKNEPEKLIFGFQKDDKVVITLSTNKNKPLEKLEVSENNKILFSKEDVDVTKPIEILIPQTNFVHFSFYGKALGQNVNVKIERIPAVDSGRFFNSAIQLYKNYDTSYVEYEIDSVVGYDEIHTPKKFKVIASSDYESVVMHEQQLKIYGSDKKGILITQPQSKIVSDDKEMKLVGYQIVMSSSAGASEMWDAIGVGVDIGCLCMELLLPAGGTAAALGVEQAFDMIGPQEGGEPVYYVIMENQKNLDVFLDNNPDTNPMAYESGLVTGYNSTWLPLDTIAIGLKNLNIAVEVDVTIAVYAIYQTTIWQTISQDIVTIKPKTVKVKRTRQVISNNKYWNFQD